MNQTNITSGAESFQCSLCYQIKPIQSAGGSGYALTSDERKVCYECCRKEDIADMMEMGKATLYFIGNDNTNYELTNWPGSIRFRPYKTAIGRHNIAGRRYDVWFIGPDKATWHGVTYGDNTKICHCRRTKG